MKTFEYQGKLIAAGSQAAELLSEKRFSELDKHLKALEDAKNRMEGANTTLLPGFKVYKTSLVKEATIWDTRIYVNPDYWDQFLADIQTGLTKAGQQAKL